MHVILLAGYRPCDEFSCPWLQSEQGRPKLEQRARQAYQLKLNPIVVLGGQGQVAEEALRHCPSLEKCELVFDTQIHPPPNLISNLKAALKLNVDMALLLPAEWSFGDTQIVDQLTQFAIQQGPRVPYDLIQAVDENGELINGGFPLVVTYRGCHQIVRSKHLVSLAEGSLNFHQVHLPAVVR